MDYAKHRIPAPRSMHDAFLLYREGEAAVASINEWLAQNDVDTYYFNNDVALGDVIDEQAELGISSTVVVFLGEQGWGPSQIQLVSLALAQGKPILPVLIGEASKSEKSRVKGLFIEKRYLDLTVLTTAKLEQLRAQIVQNMRTRGIDLDAMLRCLIEGTEAERQHALTEIEAADDNDRAILGKRLRALLDAKGNGKQLSEAAKRTAVRYESYQSWLCSALIWADPEHLATRGILQALMKEKHRTNASLRFWILAGAYQNDLSYLNELAREAFDDPAPENQLLAEAMVGPDSPAVQNRLVAALTGPDMQNIWTGLRVLRIIPIDRAAPRLCELVSELDGEMPVAYDLFCALSTPPMAAAVAPRLTHSPGIQEIVHLMLRVLVGSDRFNIRRFAVLARAFDHATITAALREYASGSTLQPYALALLDVLRETAANQSAGLIPVAGYRSDTVHGQADQLDIRTEVTVLTAIMLSKEVTPPLAIGLFGRWGSGKSFFMREMQRTADHLASNARTGDAAHFCKDIVQIEFNAWHYVDTNLWASLASCILDQLAGHIFGPKMSASARHAALVSDLTTTKAAHKMVEEEKTRVDAQLHAAEQTLQQIQQKKNEAEVKLSDLKVGDFIQLAVSNPQLREGAEAAMKSLGIPAAVESYAALDAAAQQSRTTGVRAGALAMALATKTSPAGMAVMVFILLLPFLAFWLVNFWQGQHESLLVIGAVVTQVAAIANTVIRRVSKAVRTVSEKIAIIEEARLRAQELLRQKRAETSAEEAKLKAAIEQARISEIEAKERLSIAASRVAEVEAQLRDLEEKSSLGWFLNERLKGDDYRKHLGLIATIRADFQALVDRLAQQDKIPLPPGHAPVERIVLYIDDLDRCPASKVVEVLQAVHLLLAYPLFVVVVGVDAHWLIESLKTHHRAMGSVGGQADRDASMTEWSATPQRYLEKIFQIPFALRPMDQPGYERLMRQLMTGRPAGESNAKDGGDVDADVDQAARGEITYPKLSGDLPNESVPAKQHGADSISTVDRPVENREDQAFVLSGGVASTGNAASPVLESRALSLQANEVAFAGRLFEFIASPRAAKRLSNTYRVLKARVGPERLLVFEGSEMRAGEFEVPMLLLAILIDNPQVAKIWFPALAEHADRYDTAAELLTAPVLGDSLDPATETETEKVGRLVRHIRFEHRADLIIEWIPHVVRFSFDAA